jgi:hypothetical protein
MNLENPSLKPRLGRKRTARLIRNVFLTFSLLLPVVGYLLFSDASQACAPMDKKPWVHWNGLDPSTEVHITWETAAALPSYLAYGTDQSALTNQLANASSDTLHRFRLTSLTPDTRYYYRASHDNSTTYASGTFTTAPTVMSSANFSFAILSDTQMWMGTGHYERLCRAMASLQDVSFIAYAGDMAQEHGQFSVLTEDSAQPTLNLFWQYTNLYTPTIPIVPDPGNHDASDYGNNLYSRYYGLSTPLDHNYYTFNWSRTQFVMAEIADTADADPTKPYNIDHDVWMNATLEAGMALDYRIIVFHRSWYSSYGINQDINSNKYNVSLVLYGHDHSYERYLVQNHTLIQLGSGGAFMNSEVRWRPEAQSIRLGPSFTKISCNATGIAITTLSPEMDVLDQVRLTRNGGMLTPDWAI